MICWDKPKTTKQPVILDVIEWDTLWPKPVCALARPFDIVMAAKRDTFDSISPSLNSMRFNLSERIWGGGPASTGDHLGSHRPRVMPIAFCQNMSAPSFHHGAIPTYSTIDFGDKVNISTLLFSFGHPCILPNVQLKISCLYLLTYCILTLRLANYIFNFFLQATNTQNFTYIRSISNS